MNVAEELLDGLKTALADSTLPQPRIGEIGDVEMMLKRLRGADGAALITGYHWWREHYPSMTAAMVRAAKAREQAERRALVAYVRLTDPGRRPA